MISLWLLKQTSYDFVELENTLLDMDKISEWLIFIYLVKLQINSGATTIRT